MEAVWKVTGVEVQTAIEASSEVTSDPTCNNKGRGILLPLRVFMASFRALPIHGLDKMNEHAFFEIFSGQECLGDRNTGRGILNVAQVIQIINNRA